MKVRPWTVKVDGQVAKPGELAIDDLLEQFPLEERVYRLRCVEAWSMVIPWVGFPLGDLLKKVEPTAKAKYVAFETLLGPARCPASARRRCSGPTSKGCAWTRRCTR